MTAQESRELREKPTGLVRFAWLLALAFGVTIAVLAFFRVEEVYSSPTLFTVLNIAFLSVISFVVSWVAARSYLRDGSKAVLLLGCGTLALGLGGLLAPLHIGGPGANSIATIYNSAALMAGACHLFSSVGSLSARSGRRLWDWRRLLAGYLTIVALVCALVILVRIGLWPTYFVEGSGATGYGDVVLYGATALFALSAVLLGVDLGRPKSSFRAWYSLGLGLIAIGLVGISLQLKMGDPLNWVGRSAQYLGCVCMLIAVVSTAMSSGFWMLTVERALRASEERYRTIVENMPIGFFQDRAEGGLVYANPAHAKFLGYDSPAELAAATDEDAGAVSHYAEPARRVAFVDQAIRADGEWREFENRYRRKDGSYADALLYMSYRLDPGTGEYLTYGFVQDISERKRAEEALSENQLRYETFINATDDMAFLKDDELRYVIVNAANAAYFGRSVEETVGRTDADLMPSEAAARCQHSDMDVLESRGAVLSHEEVDGRIYETRKFPVALAGDRVGVGGYVRDVTARKQAEEELLRHAEQLRRTVEGAVLAMSRMVESRDPYTAGHERRVAELAAAIGGEMGISGADLEALRLAGTIHDIGKIAVPAEILSKPGLLSELEFSLIKAHPATAFDILAGVDFGRPVAEMVLQHHERLDGSGYPAGLQGDEILPEARILAVADVVEAMSSHRPYRAALGMDAALAEIREHAGVKFDADAVAACERVFERGFVFTEP